jgi:hypothetical protein
MTENDEFFVAHLAFVERLSQPHETFTHSVKVFPVNLFDTRLILRPEIVDFGNEFIPRLHQIGWSLGYFLLHLGFLSWFWVNKKAGYNLVSGQQAERSSQPEVELFGNRHPHRTTISIDGFAIGHQSQIIEHRANFQAMFPVAIIRHVRTDVTDRVTAIGNPETDQPIQLAIRADPRGINLGDGCPNDCFHCSMISCK